MMSSFPVFARTDTNAHTHKKRETNASATENNTYFAQLSWRTDKNDTTALWHNDGVMSVTICVSGINDVYVWQKWRPCDRQTVDWSAVDIATVVANNGERGLRRCGAWRRGINQSTPRGTALTVTNPTTNDMWFIYAVVLLRVS